MNRDRGLFGESRLEEFLVSTAETDADGMVKGVLSAVRRFADGAEQSDDITVLAFTYDIDPETEAAHSLNIRIPNEQSAIAQATEKFQAFAEEHGVPTQDIMRVNLAFDEILSNIISYGYEDDATHEIAIGVDVTPGQLVVSIEDDGLPFNPLARKEPDTSLSIEDRAIGGLGIHLVKNVMDEATYHRRQNGNCLVLSKNLE